MTDVAKLGGGYADSTPDAKPTAEALLAAARPGASSARLVIIGGPPGVGKTAVARALLSLLPNTFLIDKDQTAGGFILTAAAQRGDPPASAYGTSHYWQQLRPLEYAGPLTTACSNLVGTRQILLVGGFGPELGENDLWPSLGKKIAPAPLRVLHLDPPPLETWRARMAGRGSPCDSPYFENLAQALGALPVWSGATCIDTDAPLYSVVQRTLDTLG